MISILEKIGFRVEGETVFAPSWRGDVAHWSDLAEEVARFYGYDKIEPTLFAGKAAPGGLTRRQAALAEVGRLLRGMGYFEILTYSFIGHSDYDKINMPVDAPERRSVTILNPLGEERSVMRTTPLPSMLDALRRNAAARRTTARLYEAARVYRPADGAALPDEHIILTLGAYDDIDFYGMKGAVETLLGALRVRDAEFRPRADIPSFHPGRCADIYVRDMKIGVLGQIHPSVTDNYGLPETYAAEINFYILLQLCPEESKYTPLPRYPAVERDIAVVCGVDIPVAEMSRVIWRGGGGFLRDVKLFDIYTGAPIPAGKKSLAFSLSFRSDESTLTDEDADAAVRDILALLEGAFRATIRGA
jgi:phenylalanyl-tRNA synthetase beta chain